MSTKATLADLKKYHSDMLPKLRELCREAVFILEPALKRAGIKTASIEQRVKHESSFVEKGIRREIADPTEIQDFAGARIVVVFISDLERVGGIIRKNFDVVSVDDKIEGYDAARFGYFSIHYIVKLKKTYKGPRYSPLAGLCLEIQVRTLLMHAWANVSHYLSYKSDTDVPLPLQRDFYAISGLLYAADKHFELFFEQSIKSQRAATKSLSASRPDLRQDLNLDSLTAYLRRRYKNRRHGDPEAVSELVAELRTAGYSTLSKLDSMLNLGEPVFPSYEKLDPPNNQRGKRYIDIGVVRLTLGIADKQYRASKYKGSKSFDQFDRK